MQPDRRVNKRKQRELSRLKRRRTGRSRGRRHRNRLHERRGRKREREGYRGRGGHGRGRRSIKGGGLIKSDIPRDTDSLNNQIVAMIPLML